MKRTEIKRTAFHRKEPSISRSEHPRAKDKECANPGCRTKFTPVRPMQQVCSPICAAQKVKADAKAERAKTKARKEAIKTIPDLIREAQKEFNAYIRARDKDQPCICCGVHLSSGEVGGAFDCGHYRSVGSAPHLRYDERNAHGQRKRCNRYGAGRAVDYRLGLIARLGREAVEALEADNRIHKWRREELIELKATYRAKRRALNQLNATP